MSSIAQGRSSRRTYVKATLFLWTLRLSLGIGIVLNAPHNLRLVMVFALASLFVYLYQIPFLIRRCHDIGRSGHLVWLLIVPLANLYLHALLLFCKGDSEANRYGLKPIDEGSEFTTQLVVSTLVLIGVVAVFGSSLRQKLQGETPRPRTFQLAEVSLQGRLRQNPCDSQVAYDLSQSYLSSRHYQDAIELETAFHSHCKKVVIQLKWAAYESARRLKNYPLALSMIDQLIQRYPRDADYYGWRGLLYEELEQWDKAAGDFEEVLRLKPKIISVPLNLVDAYRRLNQACKALEVHRRYGERHPDMLEDAGFMELRQELEQDCKAQSPS